VRRNEALLKESRTPLELARIKGGIWGKEGGEDSKITKLSFGTGRIPGKRFFSGLLEKKA